MLLLAFLPATMPTGNAAVAGALKITVNELYDRTDEYVPTNTAGTGGTLTPGTFSGVGYVAITSGLTTTTLYDVNIVFDKGSTTGWSTTSANVVVYDNTPASDQVTISIAKLTPTGQINVNYNLPVTTQVPVYMTTSYSRNSVIVANDGVGTSDVTLNVIANSAFIGANTIEDINVTVTSVDRDGDLVPDWELSLYPGGGAAASSFLWSIGGLSAANTTATGTYRVTPVDIDAFPTTDDYVLTGLASSWAKFSVTSTSETLTGVNVIGSPTAGTSNLQLDLTKESVPNNGGGDDWQFTPSIKNTNTEALDFELTSASLWVCALSDLNTVARSQAYGPTLDATFEAGETWNGATFNVYDFAGTPVGFLKPVLTIKDTSDTTDQITQTFNMGFDDTYQIVLNQQIYIVNGYYVKVTKTIADIGSSQYRITLKVENLGNRPTPPHIFVYDVVDGDWTYEESMDNPDYTGHIAVTNTNFPGMAYWWDVGTLAAANAGTTDEYTIQYVVTGTGDYPITDLYLVGLDPSLSDMFQSSPSIENAMTIVNSNIEYVMMLGALGVFAIGMFGTFRRRF